MSRRGRLRRRQTSLRMGKFYSNQCRSGDERLAHDQRETGSPVPVNVPVISPPTRYFGSGVPAAANRSGCHALLVFPGKTPCKRGVKFQTSNSSLIVLASNARGGWKSKFKI